MKKVPFNVSARTARLIGRENVSSAEGALIELVKNSYDADAKICVVYFDDSFAELPKSASQHQIDSLVKITGAKSIFQCYEKNLFDDKWAFSDRLYNTHFNREQRHAIEACLLKTVGLHIFDDGHGMLEEVIESSWMTIGTDNKHQNFLSEKTGRIKSGAKGIGRFALDRLGEKCQLLTKTADSDTTLAWRVDWSDFDKQGATIDKINAELGASPVSLCENLLSIESPSLSALDISQSRKGTHIFVSSLRDAWTKDSIERIYKELETLVPPTEGGSFSIHLFSKAHPESFGIVEPTICDDYDCKVHVELNEDGVISFTFNRHEADPNKLTPELLSRSYFQENDISKEYLCNKPHTYSKYLTELIPGITEHRENVHKTIGTFEFTFYFLKRQSEKNDIATFLHRNYDSSARKKWLDNNSGIRIYRDNFRVRPYGEVGKPSWDWVGLSARQAGDPSALRTGRWRVSPNNISGSINISRVKNLELEDKSSREGMRENDSFAIFTNIIESIIKEFEQDRSNIYSEIFKYSDSLKDTPTDEHLNLAQEADAETLAQKIFANIKTEPLKVKNDSDKLAVALLKAKARSREADERLDEMKRENSLLRVFASSGLTIAAFTHELDGLNAKLGGRFDQLRELLNSYLELSISERLHVQNYQDPFKRIETLRRDDEKIKNWIRYSLRTIRKDKRSRKKILLLDYFENLRDEWNSTLIDRQIDIKITVNDNDASLKAYEIDLDCIFNNLIINSTEAFKRSGFSGERQITIEIRDHENTILFIYKDSGPGLSPDIKDPDEIFIANYSTKINKQGQQVGTGLGMWLVKKTIEEYSGSVKIKKTQGFVLEMEIKK